MQDHHSAAPTDSLRSDSWSSREISISEWFSSAIRKADPNHMYQGCRFHGEALPDPELFCAIGKYAAAVSVNVYGIWKLDSEIITTWEARVRRGFSRDRVLRKG